MTLCQNWITEHDLADCNMCDVGGLAENQAYQIITTASQILYLLTGQQFPGQCVDTVRPCNCGDCSGLPFPVRFSSGWRNVCGDCGGYCAASGAAILLPKRPVISVQTVLIDGVAESDFRLDSPGWLVRTDGGSWPTCQDITTDTSQTGTWEISYTYGKVPPEALRFAATVLSSELVKACLGDSGCRIPAGAVSVQRQGVSYDFSVTEGKTGLYEVDLIVDTFNPHRIARKARVYSADDHQWARTVSGS
jgi:hypothetical protein